MQVAASNALASDHHGAGCAGRQFDGALREMGLLVLRALRARQQRQHGVQISAASLPLWSRARLRGVSTLNTCVRQSRALAGDGRFGID